MTSAVGPCHRERHERPEHHEIHTAVLESGGNLFYFFLFVVMDFQMQLLQVDQALTKTDVQALAFLCTDLLGKDLSDISCVSELFSLLQKQDLLSSDQTSILTELLLVSKHQGLVRQLGLPNLLPEFRFISFYREMLFDLSENITADDLRDIKFLLHDTLPRKKLNESSTMLKLLTEMEKEDLLSSTNLQTLEKVVRCVCPNLTVKINRYKQVTGKHSEPPRAQETGTSEKRPETKEGSPTLQVHMDHTFSSLISTFICLEDLCFLFSSLFLWLILHLIYNSHVSHTCLHEETYDSHAPEDQIFGTSVTPLHYEEQKLAVYSMKGEKRGFCLIINNYNFSLSGRNLKNRDGTHIDKNNLEAVFQWLGFETQVKQDCSRRQILTLLQDLRNRDHTDMDCFVCCMLSHGMPGAVYGVDGGEVRVSELLEPFSGHHCVSLQQKPKLFFIQACQGTREQQPVFLQSDSPLGVASDASVPQDSFPTDADFLLGMATMPDFVSFRDKKQGTWYIRSLCKNLLLLVPSGADLLSILTKVNNDVSNLTDSGGTKKQMPQPAYTLRKKVIFPRPKKPAPVLE
ncbi:caspase-8-like isoform X1 [Arapaima gigas]